jgi:LytS/YehU family sensor histidine kinase
LNARRAADNLFVEIKDNGPGPAPSKKSSTRTGLGLANTRARLEQLYPALHRLEISNGANNGFAVTLLIPFHEDLPKPLAGVEPSLVENVIP